MKGFVDTRYTRYYVCKILLPKWLAVVAWRHVEIYFGHFPSVNTEKVRTLPSSTIGLLVMWNHRHIKTYYMPKCETISWTQFDNNSKVVPFLYRCGQLTDCSLINNFESIERYEEASIYHESQLLSCLQFGSICCLAQHSIHYLYCTVFKPNTV